jgi:hypothetical protein
MSTEINNECPEWTEKHLRLKTFFEKREFVVYAGTEKNEAYAEIEKWTKGGVDMIMLIQPFTVESFLKVVEDFNVDEEIEVHRQDSSYKRQFTIDKSLKDFTDFHNHLKEVAAELTK